jgi:hypothetical protein
VKTAPRTNFDIIIMNSCKMEIDKKIGIFRVQKSHIGKITNKYYSILIMIFQ